jgi:hypothetical protein
MAWPMLDFTEPNPTGRARSPSAPGRSNTWRSVAISTLSPARVAEPCASISPTVAGSSPAASHARSIASTWPLRAGLISVAARPSLDTPTPRMTAYTRSPAARASARRLSTTMPVPSPMRMPSARRSNGRITPVGLSALSWEKTLHSVTSWQ